MAHHSFDGPLRRQGQIAVQLHGIATLAQHFPGDIPILGDRQVVEDQHVSFFIGHELSLVGIGARLRCAVRQGT